MIIPRKQTIDKIFSFLLSQKNKSYTDSLQHFAWKVNISIMPLSHALKYLKHEKLIKISKTGKYKTVEVI